MALNLCTAVLPNFSWQDAIEISIASGYQGIELRVNDNYHQSLDELETTGMAVKRQLVRAGLNVPILNSYIPINDEETVDRLIYCSQIMEVPKVRVVLPRSCQASVSRQANVKEIIPSYHASQEPVKLMDDLRRALKVLEKKAYKAEVTILLELHWGTVMSSFTSAYFLTRELDPDCIAITFDPANMLVEGKEDWEFGIKLIRNHLRNVHVKNMIWAYNQSNWSWAWASLMTGMVDWTELLSLLEKNQYQGDYAIEDFLTPRHDKKSAINYLSESKTQFNRLYHSARIINASSLDTVAS